MKKLMLAAAAMLTVASPLAAYAAPPKSSTAAKPHKTKDTIQVGRTEYTTGVVASWSADTRMLKLNAGEEFKLAPTVTAATYKAGDKVNVRWTIKDGVRTADAVTMK
jgi:hypothetical protein